jgi:CBS domain-containing protein
VDVRAFLLEHPPFDALSDENLDRVVGSVEIEHFAPGTVILQQAGAPATHLFVVRRGEVEILDDARVIDVVGEGEVFGMWSLLGHVAPMASVRAAEDTLCYLIDAGVAGEVLRTGEGIAFVAASVRRRVARVDAALSAAIDPVRYRDVGEIVRRAPVTCEPSTPVADAAALMARERISSLLIPSPDGGVGILTDRDLRSRVVAERRSGDTPVAQVMTPRAETVAAGAMVGEVLLRMLEGGFHHLPVEDDGGRVIGVVTDTDLMGVGRETPFALKSEVERARDRDAVVAALRGLPRVVATLVESSADPVDVGHVIAFSIDAGTRRLLQLGIEELDEPPVRWTWLALGSAARQEQSMRTDQDHALSFEGDREAGRTLAPLAEFVTAGLESAGFARCEANVMATNEALRLPLPDWVARFDHWMNEQSPKASEQLSIVFDFRAVDGDLRAEDALNAAMATAVDRPMFLRHLTQRALDLKPPIGFTRGRFVLEHGGKHPGTVDLKHGGIVIIGNIARAHAIRSGVTAKRTLDRLRAAEGRGAIDAETREGLEESFRFLWEVRLRHHVDRWRAGTDPDDFVDPDELGAVARNGLKEAFRIIARAQKGLSLVTGSRFR